MRLDLRLQQPEARLGHLALYQLAVAALPEIEDREESAGGGDQQRSEGRFQVPGWPSRDAASQVPP